MASTSLSQASQAIELLFGNSTPQAQRREADTWLQGFQSSPEAWIVADAFLAEDPSSSQVAAQRVLFAALTLQKKIGTDFAQLPPTSLDSLRQTILAHITRFCRTVTQQIAQSPENVYVGKSTSSGGESPTILRNLCIAYASLLIQAGAPPALALRDLCLQLSIPEGSVALLEILRALPEELDSRSRKFRNSAASNSAVEAHEDMQRMLTLCAPDVLLLLLSIMKANVQTQYMSIYAGVFFALAAWVSCVKDPIPANLLAESGLLQACIEALLKYPQLFGSASLVLQEVIGRYPRYKASSVTPVAEIILPGILSLEPLFINAHAKGEAGEDECLVLSRLFSEAAYCYLYWMLRPADEAGMTILTPGAPGGPLMTEYRNRYINILSRCMSHPNNNVAGATFRFWLMMRDVFQRDPTELARKDESYVGRDFRNLLKQSLAPSLMALAKLVVQRLRFPSGNAWTDIPDDLKDEFRHQFRYDCHDTLLLCSSVTGYKDVLSFLAHSLQTEMGTFSARHQLSGQRMDSPGWEGVEACLYGIRCISKDVPPEEGEVMPAVFELLPRLPPHTELQATCFRIMGYYAPWLRAHESSVPTLVDYICTHGVAVQTPSGGVPLASPPQECAARALREIGKKCLSTAAPQLLSLPGRVNLLAMHVMNFKEAAAIIIEAIATFSNDKPAALLQLARPIFARLQHFVADRDGALAASASDGLLASLLTLQDGVLTTRQNLKFYFDLDEDQCSNLLDYARQQGGSLLPQLPHMSKKTLEVVTLNIIRNLLEKVMYLTFNLEPNVDALSEAAGIIPKGMSTQIVRTDIWERRDNSAWDAVKQQQAVLMQEAKARCAEAAMALQKEFWPVGEALWMSYGSTFDGADLMQRIGDVWTYGFLLCGPNFSQFVTPIGSLIGRRLSIANSPQHPPAPEAIKVLYYVIKRMGVIFDANTDPSCTSAVNELVRVIEGITNVVFTSITAFRQGGKNAALLASAQTTQQREEIAQAAMKESFIENFSLLDNFFHLLREAVRCIPDRILSSPVFPSVLETLVAGLPFGYGGLADSFLLFTCELCRLDRDPSMAANKQRYLEGLLMAPLTRSALSCSLLGPQSNTGSNSSALESLTRQLLKCISKANYYDFVYAHRQIGGSSERPVLTEALHGLYMLAPGVIMPMVLTALQDPSVIAPLADHGPLTQTAFAAIQKRLFNSVPTLGSLSPSSSLPGPFSSWRDLFTDLLKITRGKTREGWEYLCSEPTEDDYDEDDYDYGHDRLFAEDKDEAADSEEQDTEDDTGYGYSGGSAGGYGRS
jgi:hypothetical protein